MIAKIVSVNRLSNVDNSDPLLSRATSLDVPLADQDRLQVRATLSPLLGDLRSAVSLGDVSIPNELLVSLPARTASKSLLDDSSMQWHANGSIRTRSASEVKLT